MTKADLLFELGTEELPPPALQTLSRALETEFVAGLEKAGLEKATAAKQVGRRSGLVNPIRPRSWRPLWRRRIRTKTEAFRLKKLRPQIRRSRVCTRPPTRIKMAA